MMIIRSIRFNQRNKQHILTHKLSFPSHPLVLINRFDNFLLLFRTKNLSVKLESLKHIYQFPINPLIMHKILFPSNLWKPAPFLLPLFWLSIADSNRRPVVSPTWKQVRAEKIARLWLAMNQWARWLIITSPLPLWVISLFAKSPVMIAKLLISVNRCWCWCSACFGWTKRRWIYIARFTYMSFCKPWMYCLKTSWKYSKWNTSIQVIPYAIVPTRLMENTKNLITWAKLTP